MKRFLPLIAVVVASGSAVVTPANAQVTRKKAMWGPLEYRGKSQMPVYAELGVGIWQTTVSWADVAPTRPTNPRDPGDPAYRWPVEIDRAVKQGRRYGIQVSIMLVGAPGWANGGRDWQHAPEQPRDFADFAAAAARRYPRVHHWMIWGEPTRIFQPMEPDHGRPLRGRGLRGPRLYARILDASYGALKRVSRRNKVIGGNTYTVGAVAPLRFVRALRLPNGRPPRMDLWGHNPFSARPPDLSAPPLGDGYADFSDLDELASVLDRNMRKRLRIFISEYALATDHPNAEFNFYVDRKTQADWIARALRITRSYRRIYTFGYLGLYDPEPRPAGDQTDWGLITREGKRRPAFKAFARG